MAAPTFVDNEFNPDAGAGASVSSLVFNWTDFTGEADNDVVVVAIYRETTAAYTATPANWAQVAGFPQSQDTGGFKYEVDLWWRRRSGDTGTATWSWTGAAWGFLGAVGYRGLITTETPIIGASFDKEAAQNTEPAHPGITIERSNSGLLWVVWNFAATTNDGDPSGFTDRLALTSEIHIFDDLTVSPGASGTVTGNLGNPEFASSVLMELITEANQTAAITGTATASITEADIVAGGKTIIETLTGTTFKPAAGTPTYSTGTAKSTTTAPGRTGNGDLTISFPPSYTPTAGDFALIWLYHDQGTGSLPSGGWAEVTGSPWGSATPKLQAFWKVLAGGESAPVSTISGSGTNISHCANMAIYTGVGSIGAIGTASAGTGTPMTAGAINTTANNSVVVAGAGRGDNENASNQTFNGSTTGVVERLDGGTDQGNDSQVSMADISIATSGSSSGNFSSDTSATDPWVCVQLELKPSTPFDDARQAIINGLDSAQAEATGWDAVVKAGLAVTTVVRTSDTVVTITLSAFASYNITAQETITVTVPAAALVSGGPITGSPTFTVATAGTAVTPNPIVVNVRVVAPSLALNYTPAALSVPVRVVAPTLNLALTPAAKAVSVSVVAPTLALNLTPAATTANVRVAASSLALNLTPAATAVSVSVVAPSVTLSFNVTPSPIVASVDVIDPSLSLNLTPAAAAVAVTVIQPAISLALTPATEQVSVSVVSPNMALALTPASEVVSVSVVAPAISLNYTPATVVVSVLVVAPSTSGAVNVTPDAIVVDARVVAPALSLNLTPASETVNVTVVAFGMALNLTPASESVSVAVVNPSVTLAFSLTPITVNVLVIAPVVTIGGAIIVSPAPTVVLVAVVAPTVTLTGGAPAEEPEEGSGWIARGRRRFFQRPWLWRPEPREAEIPRNRVIIHEAEPIVVLVSVLPVSTFLFYGNEFQEDDWLTGLIPAELYLMETR